MTKISMERIDDLISSDGSVATRWKIKQYPFVVGREVETKQWQIFASPDHFDERVDSERFLRVDAWIEQFVPINQFSTRAQALDMLSMLLDDEATHTFKLKSSEYKAQNALKDQLLDLRHNLKQSTQARNHTPGFLHYCIHN